MRYSEIIDYPRPWNRAKYPSVAHVIVPAEQFSTIERLIEDQNHTAVLGHDLADHNQIIIYVGCTSDEVKAMVESRFNV
jgi:hypothetical protein